MFISLKVVRLAWKIFACLILFEKRPIWSVQFVEKGINLRSPLQLEGWDLGSLIIDGLAMSSFWNFTVKRPTTTASCSAVVRESKKCCRLIAARVVSRTRCCSGALADRLPQQQRPCPAAGYDQLIFLRKWKQLLLFRRSLIVSLVLGSQYHACRRLSLDYGSLSGKFHNRGFSDHWYYDTSF